MHTYLKSLGFSKYQTKRDANKLLQDLQDSNEGLARIIYYNKEDIRFEMRIPLAIGMGIVIIGSIGEDGSYIRENYYPYLDTMDISSGAICSIQRHIAMEEYSGLLDDNRVGISLIFRLSNDSEYLDRLYKHKSVKVLDTYLNAWSDNGKILFPVKKTKKEVYLSKIKAGKRDSLIEAAKNGDEVAMESLSLEDMSLYAMANKRLMTEDIYSIVDSCFIPQGVECDVYLVIGDILDMDIKINYLTGEEVYDFKIDCNDIILHIAINKVDLQGKPEVGMRFKGRIWLQGRVSFKESLADAT